MASDRSDSRRLEIRLLAGFQMRCTGNVVITLPACQRVLAFLALTDRSLPRGYVAASLWPDTTDYKACANLRTVLWHLHQLDHDVLHVSGSNLGLRSDVWVDVRYVAQVAREHRTRGTLPGYEFVERIHGELLPGRGDPWLVFERERLRHEMTHLFEVVCHEALDRGDGRVAVLAGSAAVECDPMRESCNAYLIKAHLADGNRAGAQRVFLRYEESLRDEFGLCPSGDLVALIRC